MDPHSEARLDAVCPIFSIRVRHHADLLLAEGTEERVTQAVRLYSEQDLLWAKGRTVMSDVGCMHGGNVRKPGMCPVHPFGATVTNAKGGESWHNFGLAVDVVPDDPNRPGFQPDWNSPKWKRIVELAPQCQLRDGISWHDQPHLQPEEIPASPTDEDRQLFMGGGMYAVWDKYGLVNSAT